MLRIFFTIICFFLSNIIVSQSFEGIIDYEIDYKSNSESISVKDLEKQGGTTTKTYYKDGYFLDICKSDFMSLQLYRSQDKYRYYKKTIENDTLFKTSIASKNKKDFKYKRIKNADTILGYKCDKLIVYDDQRKIKTTYYYSKKISLKTKYYKGFTDLNKDKIVKIMKSYYLRFTYESEYFNVDIVATSITPKKLNDSIFAIPKHQYLKVDE